MATTEGLTRATTSAIEGNIGACPSVDGGVQPGSTGVTLVVGGGLVVAGGNSNDGSGQPLPTKRNTVISRQASRYFRFIFFMVGLILAWGQSLGKGLLALSFCYAKEVKSAKLQVNPPKSRFAFSYSAIV